MDFYHFLGPQGTKHCLIILLNEYCLVVGAIKKEKNINTSYCLCFVSIQFTQVSSHYQGILPENTPKSLPSIWLLWELYLFPWASWRVTHWGRRKGSQRAARRPLGGADTQTAVSRCGSGPPEHAAPQRGPAAHRCPASDHYLHWAAGQDSRWTGCPPEGPAGLGTGSNKRLWAFTLEPVWLTYPWGLIETIPAGDFWGWNSNLWWWIFWLWGQTESQNH